MSGINRGKLIVSGLVAGVVINIVESVVNLFLIADQMDENLLALNLEPIAGAAIGGFVVLGFLLGILIMWTYAAIRPRFGPGPATAVKAGIAVWGAFYLLGFGGNWLSGVVPTTLYLIVLAYTLVMMVAAAYAGGLVYAED